MPGTTSGGSSSHRRGATSRGARSSPNGASPISVGNADDSPLVAQSARSSPSLEEFRSTPPRLERLALDRPGPKHAQVGTAHADLAPKEGHFGDPVPWRARCLSNGSIDHRCCNPCGCSVGPRNYQVSTVHGLVSNQASEAVFIERRRIQPSPSWFVQDRLVAPTVRPKVLGHCSRPGCLLIPRWPLAPELCTPRAERGDRRLRDLGELVSARVVAFPTDPKVSRQAAT